MLCGVCVVCVCARVSVYVSVHVCVFLLLRVCVCVCTGQVKKVHVMEGLQTRVFRGITFERSGSQNDSPKDFQNALEAQQNNPNPRNGAKTETLTTGQEELAAIHRLGNTARC